MQIFEKMGIPGPKPNFLFGNLLSFWRMVSFFPPSKDSFADKI